LPPGAEQGPRTWYLIRLHFRIVFAHDSGPGFTYVSGLTDGHGAAQAEFHLREAAGGGRRVIVRTLDLIEGSAKRTTSSRRINIDFKNYVQVAGVRPGRNEMTFKLEALGRTKVDRVMVFANSGLIVTHKSPAELRFHATPPTRQATTGDAFEIPFTVTNSGGRAAHDVSVAALALPRSVTPAGPAMRHFPLIAPGGRVQGSLRFVARTAGHYKIDLQAVGGAHFIDRPIEMEVVDPGSSLWETGRIAAAGAIIVAGLLCVGLSRRRRRETAAKGAGAD